MYDIASEKYEVSVIVLTYNSGLDKVFKTLNSILCQKNVRVEIVISDDGSTNDNFNAIKQYFISNHFHEYVLTKSKQNMGTVHNYYFGLVHSHGKLVKAISPGDMFYSDSTLKSWIDFNYANHFEWSFSDILCYQYENGKKKYISVNAHPNDINIYLKGTEEQKRWQYVVLKDAAVGCSMLGTREIQLKYCEEILNKSKYTEDVIWRNMMFDGLVGGYYHQNTILYEYGTGISTSKNNTWLELIEKDYSASNDLILNRETNDPFQNKMKASIRIKQGTNKMRKIFIKGNLKYLFTLRYHPRKTQVLDEEDAE